MNDAGVTPAIRSKQKCRTQAIASRIQQPTRTLNESTRTTPSVTVLCSTKRMVLRDMNTPSAV
jgi:hypothetical protein